MALSLNLRLYVYFNKRMYLQIKVVIQRTNLFDNLDCARCQILLSDPSDPTVFKRVFDMTKEECASLDCDLPYESLDPHDTTRTYTSQKRALPVNASIASEVARTNKKVNLRNLPLGVEVEE